MNIQFKDINEENWIQCVFLTTDKENKHLVCEEFVASNALSLAQSKVEKGWITKAIYDEDNMIGFTMYGYCQEDNFYEICRLMIDYKYQGKGYGKAALGRIIEEVKRFKDCNEIFLSLDPENEIGKHLYETFGFKDTGKIIDDELLYSLKLNN